MDFVAEIFLIVFCIVFLLLIVYYIYRLCKFLLYTEKNVKDYTRKKKELLDIQLEQAKKQENNDNHF